MGNFYSAAMSTMSSGLQWRDFRELTFCDPPPTTDALTAVSSLSPPMSLCFASVDLSVSRITHKLSTDFDEIFCKGGMYD